MFDAITKAIIYVVSDNFFWGSMGFTTMIGLFIGSVIYNGDLKEIKKFIISLGCYSSLIVATTNSRVLPQFAGVQARSQYMLFVGTSTVVLVTLFYLIGMVLGVVITRIAHKGVKKHGIT